MRGNGPSLNGKAGNQVVEKITPARGGPDPVVVQNEQTLVSGFFHHCGDPVPVQPGRAGEQLALEAIGQSHGIQGEFDDAVRFGQVAAAVIQ